MAKYFAATNLEICEKRYGEALTTRHNVLDMLNSMGWGLAQVTEVHAAVEMDDLRSMVAAINSEMKRLEEATAAVAIAAVSLDEACKDY